MSPSSAASDPAAQPQTPSSTPSDRRYMPSTGKLLAAIVAFLWGAGIVFNSLFGVEGGVDSSYAMGQRMAGLAGLVLFGFGARQLWFEIRARRE